MAARAKSRLRIIANNTAVPYDMDDRSHVARRSREISAALCSDIGGGDHLTEAQRQLMRSAVGLILLRENLDAKAINGEPVDSREYCAICNTLRGVLTAINLQRAPRDMTTSQADQVNRVLAYIEEAEL